LLSKQTKTHLFFSNCYKSKTKDNEHYAGIFNNVYILQENNHPWNSNSDPWLDVLKIFFNCMSFSQWL